MPWAAITIRGERLRGKGTKTELVDQARVYQGNYRENASGGEKGVPGLTPTGRKAASVIYTQRHGEYAHALEGFK